MYNKPKLERYGSFREVTKLGTCGPYDIAAYFGIGSGSDWQCGSPSTS